MKKPNKIEKKEMNETLCGKPHNNGDNRPEVCTECMMIKLGL